VQLLRSLSICLGLLVTSCLPATAANSFNYGTGETQLYRTGFGNNFNGGRWDLGGTIVDNNVLKGSSGDQWQRAYYDFARSGYDLDDGKLNFYWSSKTDRSQTGLSTLYFELNFTENRNNPGNTPSNFEESSIKFQFTPTSNNPIYQLYYDPAFCIPSTSNPCAATELPQAIQDMKSQVPLFTSVDTYERFRLTAKELPNNSLKFIPYYWSTANKQWVQFSYKGGANINTPASLVLDTNQSPTSKYIKGLDSFQSLSFQFRSDIAALDAVAITRKSSSQFQQLRLATSQTPEPSSLLGLLAVAMIGIVLKTKRY
jgi:PEP-CTERM motif